MPNDILIEFNKDKITIHHLLIFILLKSFLNKFNNKKLLKYKQ